MGTSILHERLKGASVASYYPPRIGTVKQLRSLYPDYEIIDEEEDDWIEHMNIARSRGKVVPKKKRTAAGELSSGNWGTETRLMLDRVQEIHQEEIEGMSTGWAKLRLAHNWVGILYMYCTIMHPGRRYILAVEGITLAWSLHKIRIVSMNCKMCWSIQSTPLYGFLFGLLFPNLLCPWRDF
jgi:hypothetical protein